MLRFSQIINIELPEETQQVTTSVDSHVRLEYGGVKTRVGDAAEAVAGLLALRHCECVFCRAGKQDPVRAFGNQRWIKITVSIIMFRIGKGKVIRCIVIHKEVHGFIVGQFCTQRFRNSGNVRACRARSGADHTAPAHLVVE